MSITELMKLVGDAELEFRLFQRGCSENASLGSDIGTEICIVGGPSHKKIEGGDSQLLKSIVSVWKTGGGPQRSMCSKA